MFSLFNKVFGSRDDLDDDFDDFDDVQDNPEENTAAEEVRPRLNLHFDRPSRPANNNSRVVQMRPENNGRQTPQNPQRKQQEVVLIEPRDISSAQRVCDDVKSGSTVICNIERIDRQISQRVIDYITGAAYALNGDVTKISDLIFVVTPANTYLRDVINNGQPANPGRPIREIRRPAHFQLNTDEMLARVASR